MEIKILNASLKDKNKYIIKNLNLLINSNKITGILNDNSSIITKLLINNKNNYETVFFDNKKIDSYQSNLIAYIDDINNYNFYTKTVSDEFYLIMKNVINIEKSYVKKVIATLNMVGLSKEYLNREINTLSKSEKRLIQIALNLIIDPCIIIIKEPFLYLDKNNYNIMNKVLLNLKKKYNKTIILLSNDINKLYNLSDYLIIFKDNKVLINDKTSIVFKDLSLLKNNNILLPNLILFNDLALEYNKKLNNTNDINDLIKDVYKNVFKDKKEI